MSHVGERSAGGSVSPALDSTTLGFLSLVPVGLLLLAQGLKLGFFQTLASAIPISDSNLWASCASALAAGSESYNLAWCARRPLTVLLEAPFFAIAPGSLAAVVVLQLLVVCLAFWWFLTSVGRSLPVGRGGLLAVYALGLFPVFWYGTYLGPEGVALGLTLVSAAAVIRYLASRWLPWGLLGVGTAVLVLQIRPGNFLLVAALVVGLLVIMRRAGSRWIVLVVVGVALVALFAAPARVLTAAGWPAAGHAANFWATAYSAATPEQDTWVAAYDRFGPALGCPPVAEWGPDPCLELETEQFGQSVRDAALTLIADNPLAVPRQMAANVVQLVREGYLNAIGGHPFAATATPWSSVSAAGGFGWIYLAGAVVATLLWLGSATLLVLLVVRLVRLGRRGNPLRTYAVGDSGAVVGGAMWIGLVTIVGVFTSYALVGHDEGQRHLVQSIPFVLVALAGLTARHDAVVPVEPPKPLRIWPRVLVWALVGTVAVGAAVEGRADADRLTVVRGCETDAADPDEYAVIASAPVGASGAVQGPADWRRNSDPSARVAFSQLSWMQQMLDRLPPGQVLDLRSARTGEIIPVFVSADDLGRLRDGSVGCTRTPSQYGVMVVHDLVPRS